MFYEELYCIIRLRWLCKKCYRCWWNQYRAQKKLADIRYCGGITEIPDTILYDGDTGKNNNLVRCICLGISSSISRYIYIFMRSDEYKYDITGLSFYDFAKGNRVDRLKIVLKLLKFVFLKKV